MFTGNTQARSMIFFAKITRVLQQPVADSGDSISMSMAVMAAVTMGGATEFENRYGATVAKEIDDLLLPTGVAAAGTAESFTECPRITSIRSITL